MRQLIKSKANSTSKRYLQEISKFISWGCSFEVQPKPPLSVALCVTYLSHRYNESGSYALLVLSHDALKWYHSFLPTVHVKPLDSQVCSNLQESAKRRKPPIIRKSPVSPDIIRAFVHKKANPSANLKNLRLACLCTLGFAGFFRFDELSSIAPAHFEFSATFLKVFVPRAKNDVYREGNYAYIKRLNSEFCPVNILERHMHATNIANLQIY